MNLREKLGEIQTKLKAPKGKSNTFGGYKYRSCEDILEAVKPFLAETKTVLTVSDNMVQIGERYYIEATATLHDFESEDEITNKAFAREAAEKKGMDAAQITGTASSYARKYALNGLFCIDDTKDADTDEFSKLTKTIGKNELTLLQNTLSEGQQEWALKYYKVKALSELTLGQYADVFVHLARVQEDKK